MAKLPSDEELDAIISEADDVTAIARPADRMVSKHEQLDKIKRKMLRALGALDTTVEFLKVDIPSIGARGVTMRDLHGAVISIANIAGELLDHVEELDGLREGIFRRRKGNSRSDRPDPFKLDLMGMSYSDLKRELERAKRSSNEEDVETIKRAMRDRGGRVEERVLPDRRPRLIDVYESRGSGIVSAEFELYDGSRAYAYYDMNTDEWNFKSPSGKVHINNRQRRFMRHMLQDYID